MHHVRPGKPIAVWLISCASAAFALSASTEAKAAYSGTTIRSVCAAAALSPFNFKSGLNESTFWYAPNQCQIRVWHPGAPLQVHYATVSVPVDRITTSTQLFATVGAFGSAASTNFGQICFAVFNWDTNGNLIATTSSVCTSGAGITHQQLNRSLFVAAQSAVSIDFSAYSGFDAPLGGTSAGVDVVRVQFTANGS